jgi:hypothetical protein
LFWLTCPGASRTAYRVGGREAAGEVVVVLGEPAVLEIVDVEEDGSGLATAVGPHPITNSAMVAARRHILPKRHGWLDVTALLVSARLDTASGQTIHLIRLIDADKSRVPVRVGGDGFETPLTDALLLIV